MHFLDEIERNFFNSILLSIENKNIQRALFENKGKKMTEKELVEIMYKKYNKWFLNANETAEECGMSYSKFSKLFGGQNAIPEKIILGKKIIPPWVHIGNKRMWKITEIVKWMSEMERRVG